MLAHSAERGGDAFSALTGLLAAVAAVSTGALRTGADADGASRVGGGAARDALAGL